MKLLDLGVTGSVLEKSWRINLTRHFRCPLPPSVSKSGFVVVLLPKWVLNWVAVSRPSRELNSYLRTMTDSMPARQVLVTLPSPIWQPPLGYTWRPVLLSKDEPHFNWKESTRETSLCVELLFLLKATPFPIPARLSYVSHPAKRSLVSRPYIWTLFVLSTVCRVAAWTCAMQSLLEDTLKLPALPPSSPWTPPNL